MLHITKDGIAMPVYQMYSEQLAAEHAHLPELGELLLRLERAHLQRWDLCDGFDVRRNTLLGWIRPQRVPRLSWTLAEPLTEPSMPAEPHQLHPLRLDRSKYEAIKRLLVNPAPKLLRQVTARGLLLWMLFAVERAMSITEALSKSAGGPVELSQVDLLPVDDHAKLFRDEPIPVDLDEGELKMKTTFLSNI